MKISSDLFESFLKCPTKCWLRASDEPGSGNHYAEWVKSQTASYRVTEIERLLSEIPRDESAVSPLPANLKTDRWRLAVDVLVQTPETKPPANQGGELQTSAPNASQNLLKTAPANDPTQPDWMAESFLHAVERVPSEGRGRLAQFIPIRFIFNNKLDKDDKLLLGFDAFVLSKMLGREVSIGKIVHGDAHATLKVKASALAGEARKRVEKIVALLSGSASPDLVLNRHCAECEFQARCRQKAIETDDLSLLAGMSAKERQKLRSKGIFTVTQLSYTFRPRRRPKRLRDKREKYHHSLKALAIREKKIHIVGSPELKIEGTPVYLDVEGLPDCDFYYLIGMHIGHGDSAVQHSLWADTVADEGKIWREFLSLLETVERPVLIHYGSYETTFLKKMEERYGKPKDESVAAKMIGSTISLVSMLFAKIYFPTYSNSLKDIAGWLGYRWSASNAIGTQTIIWRHRWEKSDEVNAKAELIEYNAQDCEALEMAMEIFQRLNQLDSDRITENNQQRAIVSVDTMNDQPWLFRKFTSSISELEQINKAARWNYQRDRIYVRTSEQIRSVQRSRLNRKKLIKPNKIVAVENPSRCPKCHRSMKNWPTATSILYDVCFSPGGLKRRVVQYKYRRTGCDSCHLYFGRPDDFRSHSKYGRNREKLFTFLNYDGVPWNNNNAEHAIKAFARLRRVIEGLTTRKGIEEYLTLLSVCQTCKYMGVDFLDFLRSGEKDIHAFAESRRGRRRRADSNCAADVKSTAASGSEPAPVGID